MMMSTMNYQQQVVCFNLSALVGLFLASVQSFAQQGTSHGTRENERQIVTSGQRKLTEPAQAISDALRMVGLEDRVRSTAKLVTLENDETPFLADRLNGREVWKVTVPNWSVELEAAPDEKDSYPRTLDILLDPTSGQILSVKTRWPDSIPEPKDTVEPDAKTAEEQISPDKYHGFPVHAPPISFVEALEATEAVAPLKAKQIEGLWVLYSRTDSQEPQAMWVLTFWGIPPVPVFRGGVDVPAYLRENIRFIVDPVKKRWVMASQSPHRVRVKKGKAYCEECCSRPVTHRAFVESSLDRVRGGEDVESVLATLSCIARRHHIGGYVATGAVRAIYAIAKDEARIRQHLLDIAAAPETSLSVHSATCRLLTYVADTETRRVSLELLKGSWNEGNWSGYCQLLTDLGDRAFLAWLETTLSHTPPGSRLSVLLERAVKRVRIQEDVEAILSELESGNAAMDGAWLVRQAWRHRAGRERIHDAVLSRVLHAGNEAMGLFEVAGLLRECEEVGMFTDEDQEALRQARDFLKATHVDRDPPWPEWAQPRIAAKRAEFYGL